MKVPYFKNKIKQEYANKYFDYKNHVADLESAIKLAEGGK